MFVGYDDNTTKQWKVYALDLHDVVVTSYARFKETVPGGTMDLKLRMQLLGGNFVKGQGTPNILADRKPRRRPRKTPTPTSAKAEAPLQDPVQSSTLLQNHQSTAVEDVAKPTANDTIIVDTPALVKSYSIPPLASRKPVVQGPKVTANKIEKKEAVRHSLRIQSQL